MPLPTGGQWPPHETALVGDRLNVWSAWYSGDPDALTAAYAGPAQPYTSPTAAKFFDSHSQGGTSSSGTVPRTFWGARTSPGEQRTKLHIPIAGDLAALSADLLFSDPPEMTVDDADTQARLEQYEENGLWTDLREAAEQAAALGGVYLRVVWDKAISDAPWLSTVAADCAVPEWSWNRLSAVTFWRVVDRDGPHLVRHLERHEPGAIIHGLYVGERDELGKRIPLSGHESTETLAQVADANGIIATGIPMLTATYVPNVKPNRLWRGIPSAANLGRSDFAGVEPGMDALDEVWSSWMRDVRLAKARLIIPESALETLGRGHGARFDSDREVFTGLDLGPNPDATIKPAQFDIRAADHAATAKALLEQVTRDAGYSVSSLGGSGDAAMTATEVSQRERRSLNTRGRKAAYWAAGLRQIVPALLAVDATRFGTRVTPEVPSVTFPEAVSPDPKDVAQTVQLLAAAGAVSTETKVRLVHPEWDDDEVAAEVAAITDEEDAEETTPDADDSQPPMGQDPGGEMDGTPDGPTDA